MQDVQSLIRKARDENWEELDLSGMKLTKLPTALCQPTELKSLILSKEETGKWKDGEYVPVTVANQVTHLSPQLKQLVKLSSLELSGNSLGELPKIVFELKELEFLDITNV